MTDERAPVAGSGGFGAVIRKELRSAFNTPIAWIVLVVFLVFTSIWLFVIENFVAADVASLRAYFGVMPIVFVVLLPAVTMRLWSEERRGGTDEILLTLPISDGRLVLGKFVASLVLVVVALALTAFVPLTVARLGQFERGEIVGQYIGLLLLGGTALAIGQFVSALARNQIASFLFTALVLLVFTLLARVTAVAELPRWLASTLNYLSFDYHFRSFNRGIVDTRDVAFFVVLTFTALYGTARVLLLRRMR